MHRLHGTARCFCAAPGRRSSQAYYHQCLQSILVRRPFTGFAFLDSICRFDDSLPSRKFDNFQFVNFSKIWAENTGNPEVAFAVAALMEIPEQFLAIRKLKML